MNDTAPTKLVIFGSTGDLMARMVVPSLINLARSKQLPKNFQIIAFGRRDFDSSQYIDFLQEKMKRIGTYKGDEDIKVVSPLFTYHRGDFDDIDAYYDLSKYLCGSYTPDQINILFYLPIPPEYYTNVLHNLSESGLTKSSKSDVGWTRVLVEKPFGTDLSSAEALDIQLGELFNEEQIYRIDHYLGKEIVQNILSFRFSSNIFEPALSNKYVSSITIRSLETLGIEERGEFYDGIGALRDFGPNHLLQLMSLIMMDTPETMDATGIRTARTSLFRNIRPLETKDIIENTFRAQYIGYIDEEGVAVDSQTETYFRIELEVDTERWQGVPVILESGKNLANVQKDVIITYREPDPSFEYFNERTESDHVRFDLSDDEKIELSMLFKRPSHEKVIERNTIAHNVYASTEESKRIEEYELVLLDAIKGDQTRFVSTDEVIAMWKIVDPILVAWHEDMVPLAQYNAGAEEISFG